MSGRINSTTTVGVFLLLLGLAAIFFSFQIPANSEGGTGARTFPLISASAMLLLGLFEINKGIKQSGSGFSLGQRSSSVVALFVVAVVYVFLIVKLGYLVATAAVAPVVMWTFGMRNPIALLATAIICPAVYHIIFFELLGVFPPFGEWIDLLDYLRGD